MGLVNAVMLHGQRKSFSVASFSIISNSPLSMAAAASAAAADDVASAAAADAIAASLRCCNRSCDLLINSVGVGTLPELIIAIKVSLKSDSADGDGDDENPP